MAGSKSNYLENKMLDSVFGATAYAAPATLYFALFTVAPTDAGGGTECSGGGYARASIANTTAHFAAASGGTKTNAAPIAFPWLTGTIGTPVAWGVFDAASGGNLLYWGDLAAEYQKAYNADDQPYIEVGSLSITED